MAFPEGRRTPAAHAAVSDRTRPAGVMALRAQEAFRCTGTARLIALGHWEQIAAMAYLMTLGGQSIGGH